MHGPSLPTTCKAPSRFCWTQIESISFSTQQFISCHGYRNGVGANVALEQINTKRPVVSVTIRQNISLLFLNICNAHTHTHTFTTANFCLQTGRRYTIKGRWRKMRLPFVLCTRHYHRRHWARIRFFENSSTFSLQLDHIF